ncbi:MAG: tRNA (adenosine(37)-N6)-threonylcarbamoyltransferase complex dimerization subunit type 1 TsaB [Bdellovibrionales bacterium]|nr:tRNA (adenosine(37)-N6)-threonylcarbamoyltransferase complex dimerization subunit type 1 TsaB [Bdellovibrionales bacterium]
MKYLCVETSGHASGFVAVFSDSKQEFEYRWEGELHSENITKSLKALTPYFEQLKFIAVDIGPGRFTGIRTAVNFSKTLSYYLKIPLYPCHSLRIIAEPYLENSVLCIMEAFGQMFYTSIYRKKNNDVETLLKPSVWSMQQLEEKIKEPVTAVGDVFDKYDFSKSAIKDLLKPIKECQISPYLFAQVVLKEWDEKKLQAWHEIEPCYLRVPGVIKKSQ